MSMYRWFVAVALPLALGVAAARLRRRQSRRPCPRSRRRSRRRPTASISCGATRWCAMRDGVKLRTIVLVPKGAQRRARSCSRARPTTRTSAWRAPKSPRLAAVVPQMMDTAVEAGYIVAYQDVRGKHGSEGDYVMNRPLRGPLNATEHRSRDRHVRHDRMAGAEHSREQRTRRHDWRLLRGLHGADVDRQSAPGTQGGGAFRADGGRLDGRRLVPQRRVPRRRSARVHLQPAGDARQQREVVE